MIVTFCGHAQFDKAGEFEPKILKILEENIGEKSAEIYLGGYGEFDSFARDCCKKYQAKHPLIELVLVIPYLNAKFDSARYDAVIYPEIERKLPRFAISYRNQYMVEKADLVIAYIEHAWGGAFTTYQYAKRRGKKIVNLADFRG